MGKADLGKADLGKADLGKTDLDKAELRRRLLKTRQSMLAEEWRQKSHQICGHLQTSPLFTQAQTILAYSSFRQEPDLSPLFNLNINPHAKTLTPPTTPFPQKTWGLPRCVGQSLIWHRWQPGDILEKGAYNILEPHPNAPTLEAAAVDLILIPAVGCDPRGYRLGYGGGFYDRLLTTPEWSSKPTIGIVFEFAYLPQLPLESWDMPLWEVCTETGLKLQPPPP